MANSVSLVSLFESKKSTLENRLKGLVLPNNAKEIQEIVSYYFNELFDGDGDFRQKLTQSEDYILEAAITLLNAQQKISSTLLSELNKTSLPKKLDTYSHTQENAQAIPNSKADSSYVLIGAAGGAIAGKLLLGGWGAVFGAIAGVALSVYMSNKTQSQPRLQPLVAPKTEVEENTNNPIDVDCFIGIVRDVCESVDNLIGTFRAQVNRVVQKYESQEKPTLDKEYRSLLESIQSLVGYERNHNQAEEKYVKKVCERIEDLSESLDNYDITLENYSEAKASWFDKVPSPNAIELKEVFPAVVKNGILIIPGKVFIPS